MVAVSADTPYTEPVVGFTVATVGRVLDQVPPDVPEDVNVVLAKEQTLAAPETVPALTLAFIVTPRVAKLVSPPTIILYVIVAEPTPTPVTTPVEFTEAIELLDVDQVPPATEAENVVVRPTQVVAVPEIVPTLGTG